MKTLESLIFYATYSIPAIVAYIFLMIYLRKSDFDKSIQVLFVITFIFLILVNLHRLVVDGLNLDKDYHGESFFFDILPQGISLIFFSWFLILVSTLINKSATNIGIDSKAINGIKRNIGLNVLFSIITGGIYSIFWFFRLIADLKNSFNKDIPFSAWKAFIFCFIPIFNIFWIIYLNFFIPLTVSNIEKKYFGRSVGFNYYPIFIVLYVMLTGIIYNLKILLLPDSTNQYLAIILWSTIAYFISLLNLILLQVKVNNIFSESND